MRKTITQIEQIGPTLMALGYLAYSAEKTSKLLGSSGAGCIIALASTIHMILLQEVKSFKPAVVRDWGHPTIIMSIMSTILTLALTHSRQESETIFDLNLLFPSWVMCSAMLLVVRCFTYSPEGEGVVIRSPIGKKETSKENPDTSDAEFKIY